MASREMKTYSESTILRLRNPQIMKKLRWKIKPVFVIRAALSAEKLGCGLEYCRSGKNTLGKRAVAVNPKGHSIPVLIERRPKKR